MRKLAAVLMISVLAACGGTGEPREGDRFDRMALYERHAGAPESWVRYTSIRNWWAVGLHSVVFEVGGSRHYLVKLMGPCTMDLDTAATMRLVTTRRNVLSEFDDVIVAGQTCQIQSIHELDYEAVKAELDDEGESEPERQDGLSVETEDQSSDGGM